MFGRHLQGPDGVRNIGRLLRLALAACGTLPHHPLGAPYSPDNLRAWSGEIDPPLALGLSGGMSLARLCNVAIQEIDTSNAPLVEVATHYHNIPVASHDTSFEKRRGRCQGQSDSDMRGAG
jgi:hypothetical protein